MEKKDAAGTTDAIATMVDSETKDATSVKDAKEVGDASETIDGTDIEDTAEGEPGESLGYDEEGGMDMPNRLLVIWKNLAVGGIVAGWRNRAAALSRHGIRTHFLFFHDRGGRSLLKGVAPYAIVKDEKEAARRIRNRKYGCIVVIDSRQAFSLVAASGYRGPLVVESRVSVADYVGRELREMAGLRPTCIVAASAYQKSLVSGILRNTPAVKVIPNTVDTRRFRPLPASRVPADITPPRAKGKKIIVWIGRVSREKNWELFLEVAKATAKRRDDVFFWLIGGGVNRKEMRKLRRQIRKMDLSKRYFSWRREMFPYRQMPKVYAAVAQSGGALLSTSSHESFGNVFIEAMACGCPVVAPKHTAIPEIIEDDRTGLLYRPGDRRHAMRQLRKIMDRKEKRERLIREALQDVRQKYGIRGKYTRMYVDLIRKLMTAKTAAVSEIGKTGENGDVPLLLTEE
jgi:glycosyltransferase involved in cell wall biosynthesis